MSVTGLFHIESDPQIISFTRIRVPSVDDCYTQCELRRGDTSHTAWIPTKFAKLGNGLRIKDGDEWKNGYVVTAVYQSRYKEYLRSIEHSHKRFDRVLQGH